MGKQWESFWKKESDFLTSVKTDKGSPFVKALLTYDLLKDGEKLLDCGCGNGRVDFELVSKGLQVTALDFSQEMIASVADMKKALDNTAALHPVRADMAALPFRDGSFDVTISVGAVEHWLERDQRRHVVEELTRVTRKEGKIALLIPNGRHPLYGFWRYIIKQDTPSEVRHSAGSLAEEMSQFGLSKVKVIPMGVNQEFAHYLRFKWLRPFIQGASNFIDKLPMFIRLRLTVHLICVGEKP